MAFGIKREELKEWKKAVSEGRNRIFDPLLDRRSLSRM